MYTRAKKIRALGFWAKRDKCIPWSATECRKLNRRRVLLVYSGFIPHCACCGETYERFLAVDHVYGGGSKHRRIHRGNIYSWLVKNKYPQGYQVLCHNCNQAKGTTSHCPCKQERRK